MAFQRPTAGQLDTRVELQDKATTAGSGSSSSNAYPVVDTVWARCRQSYGGRIVEGAQTQERATHNVCIRYRSDAGSWDHLEWGPSGARRQFKVLQVGDPDESREWLEILAEELRRGV